MRRLSSSTPLLSILLSSATGHRYFLASKKETEGGREDLLLLQAAGSSLHRYALGTDRSDRYGVCHSQQSIDQPWNLHLNHLLFNFIHKVGSSKSVCYTMENFLRWWYSDYGNEITVFRICVVDRPAWMEVGKWNLKFLLVFLESFSSIWNHSSLRMEASEDDVWDRLWM